MAIHSRVLGTFTRVFCKLTPAINAFFATSLLKDTLSGTSHDLMQRLFLKLPSLLKQ